MYGSSALIKRDKREIIHREEREIFQFFRRLQHGKLKKTGNMNKIEIDISIKIEDSDISSYAL